MKVEKSSLTFEDLIKGFDKPEDLDSEFIDKIRITPRYKIESTSWGTNQPEEDYAINKLGLDKIIKIIEIHDVEHLGIDKDKIRASVILSSQDEKPRKRTGKKIKCEICSNSIFNWYNLIYPFLFYK